MPASAAALDGLCPACLLAAALAPPALRIVNRLGTGPASVAYLAEDPGDPARLVVLKKMTPDADAGDVAASLERLRWRCLTLAHPHVARVLELSLDDRGQPYAVTEFWPGMPVTRYLAAAGASDMVVTQAHAALEHAHACGLVHGALTGRNVLVARTAGGPVVKILDFGHAALVGRAARTATPREDFRALANLLAVGM